MRHVGTALRIFMQSLTKAIIPLLMIVSMRGEPPRHRFSLDDIPRIRDVRDPECSPDGRFVAYIVSESDAREQTRTSHIWIVGFDGKNEQQMTSSTSSESAPRWSPDGKYLSFTSSRPGKASGNQVWLLPRNGGEAQQFTELKGRLQSYEWSPDSTRLALVVADPNLNGDPVASEGGGRAGRGLNASAGSKPIVIDRYRFKQDGQGYLLSNSPRSYVYIFDVATKKLARLTMGEWGESTPSWSPDGMRIAFTSNHAPDPDREPEAELFVAETKPGATPKALANLHNSRGGGNSRAAWSPDGKQIAFTIGDEKKWGTYNMERLAVVPTDGSAPAALLRAAADLDRGVSAPRFTADGKSVIVLVTDDRSVYPVRVPLGGGVVERLLSPPIVVNGQTVAGTCSAFISGSDSRPGEIYGFENGRLRQLSHQNDALMSELEIAPTEEVGFNSKDGTEVHGLLTKPVGYVEGTRVPLLLRIHGGPNAQESHTFNSEQQWFAANGYAVLAVNYRGSSGRGQKFSRAIFADWGHYEVEDLLAGVDHVIKMGVADPNRLGIGGWSYGAILTDYVIASDTRFKAATSGAGTAFIVSSYGTDQYIYYYENEVGPPWTKQGWETYVKIAYPFLHADRIKTPTLFLGGERDFNVPLQGSQQMYQALKSLGIDTKLIIYPDENHVISRWSNQRDRLERYLEWYNRYLKSSPER